MRKAKSEKRKPIRRISAKSIKPRSRAEHRPGNRQLRRRGRREEGREQQTANGTQQTHTLNMHSNTPAVLASLFLASAASAFADLDRLVLPPPLAQAGHFQFLTNIALAITTTYFSFSLLCHVYPCHPLLRGKTYLSALALSLNVVVSVVYWSLRLFVPQLIMADPTKDSIPLSLDLRLHLLPFLATAVDYFACMPRWDISYATAYAIFTAAASSYWFWLEYLISPQNGQMYPYPFLNVPQDVRVVIFALVGSIGFAAFCAGKVLHSGDSRAKTKV